MGKGNVCVHRPYEGLYYIDNEDLDQYRRLSDNLIKSRRELSVKGLTGTDWVLDEYETALNWQAVKASFVHEISKRFSSFTPCKEWIDRTQLAILENNLFYIVVENNEWSMAVKLIQKEHWCFDYSGLQKKHYQHYLDGIRDALFEQFDELGVYGGAWSSGVIQKKPA